MNCSCKPSYIGPSLATTCYGGTFVLFMSILDTLIRKQCSVSEMCQRIIPRLKPDSEYDFVVIGGGAAGSVIAARLSEVPNWKILLVEAGGDEPPGTQVPSMMSNFIGNPAIDWNFKTEPQNEACLSYPEKRCTWPRGKVLGGSGVINGMMYMRGLPEDYDNWERRGNPDWGFRDVFHFFKLSEGNQQVGALVSDWHHGTKGPMTTSQFPDRPVLANDVLLAAKQSNYSVVSDLNAPPYLGFTIAQATQRNGSRLSSARAYLRPARNRSNLHIMINSTATKIILENNGTKRDSSMQFVFKNKTYTVKVKREIILSAGAIKSPQVLLLSGIGPQDELAKLKIPLIHNLPGVGKNLQNHVSFLVNFQMTKIKAINDLNSKVAYDYLSFNKGPMSSTGMAQTTARICSNPRKFPYSDLQIFFNGYLADCSRCGLVGEAQVPNHPDSPRNISMAPVVLQPESRGFIGLKSADPLDLPLIQPNYLTAREDVNTLIRGIRVAQTLARSKVLTDKYGLEIARESYEDCTKTHRFDTDDFWECAVRYYTSPENHQSGSCQMGPSSDPLAVVNSKLEVKGVDGLRVIDASIMPSVVSGNTHATVVMIAEKGANYIKNKWLHT